MDLDDPQANTGAVAGDVFVLIEGLEGSRFGDDLRGSSGRNTLHGGGGGDVLIGRGGADHLWGSAGADFFVFDLGQPATTAGNIGRIFDFEPGVDTIALTGLVSTGLTAADIRASLWPSGSVGGEHQLRGVLDFSVLLPVDQAIEFYADDPAFLSSLSAADFVLPGAGDRLTWSVRPAGGGRANAITQSRATPFERRSRPPGRRRQVP